MPEELDPESSGPVQVDAGVAKEDYPRLTANGIGIGKFNAGTELLVGWTQAAKERFGATEVNSSLRSNIELSNEIVRRIVVRKIGLFMANNALAVV